MKVGQLLVFSCLSGILLSWAFPTFWPFHSPLFLWLGLGLWLYSLQKVENSWQAMGQSGLSGAVFFGSCVYWICYVTVPGYIVTTLILAGYSALFGLVAHRVYRLFPRASLWLVPMVWVVVEHFRSSYTFLRFSWFSLGHSLAEWNFWIQTADLWGVFGLSWIAAVGAALIADLGAKGFSKEAWRSRLWECAFFTLVVLFMGVYGWLRPQQLRLEPCLKVALVQASIPQEVKASGVNWELIQKKHMELTKKAYTDRPDLIVWPETMLTPLPAFVQELTSWIRRHRQPMLVGVARVWRDANGKRHFANSAVYFNEKGEVVEGPEADWRLEKGRAVRLAIYDKVYLVPISEYIPFQTTLPALARYLESWLPPGFYSMDAGDGAKVFRLKGHLFAPSICFEISFPDLFRAGAQKGTHLFLNISNDAWFRKSAELDNSRLLARLRAVETRRAVARALNGGISCVIDPRGHIVDLTDAQGCKKQVVGVLTQRTQTTQVMTVYTLYGDWPVYIFWVLFPLLLLWALFAKKLRKQQGE